MFPLPLAASAIGFLGAAIFADLMRGDSGPRSHRKSVEVCTAQCSAMWLKEDGVIRIYSDVTALNCARIIVETSALPEFPVPGEVGGHPVLIRVNPSESFGSAEDTAAERFVKFAKSTGRSTESTPSGFDRTIVKVTGPELSDRETRYLSYLKGEHEVDVHVRTEAPPIDASGSPIGPGKRLIVFTRK